MRLGNSKGNNKGKKYIIRARNNEEPSQNNSQKADRFKEWFEDHYHEVVEQMQRKQILDFDMLSETYIKIYENLLYSELEINDYKSYFFRAFFTNGVQNNVYESRYQSLPVSYDRAQPQGYDYEGERRAIQLGEDIFNYVYHRYKLREFEIFKMYMNLKPAVNYHTLAKLTDLKAHQIQFIVSKIKRDISSNPEFAMRRKSAG